MPRPHQEIIFVIEQEEAESFGENPISISPLVHFVGCITLDKMVLRSLTGDVLKFELP